MYKNQDTRLTANFLSLEICTKFWIQKLECALFESCYRFFQLVGVLLCNYYYYCYCYSYSYYFYYYYYYYLASSADFGWTWMTLATGDWACSRCFFSPLVVATSSSSRLPPAGGTTSLLHYFPSSTTSTNSAATNHEFHNVEDLTMAFGIFNFHLFKMLQNLNKNITRTSYSRRSQLWGHNMRNFLLLL